jgi:hypothetical protein
MTGYKPTIISVNAGETIDGATLPVAIYMDDTDNEVKACDGNDTAKNEFIGFAITNSTDGNPINIQTSGIVSGFTGLDIGKKYYVADDKTLSTTPGTYEIGVGFAVSATQIAIQRFDDEYIGTASISANTPTNGGTATGTATMPANARKALFVYTITAPTSTKPYYTYGNGQILRKGQTSVNFHSLITASLTYESYGYVQISGDTITATCPITVGSGYQGTIAVTLYFYR